MNINDPNVKFSSIVKIGEDVSELETITGETYLKLHRGVMDVTTLDLSSVNIDLNCKSIQQYSGNDGMSSLISSIRDHFSIQTHSIVVTPGGMSSLDLVIDSLSDDQFWVPNYHWGSWNKILSIHKKKISTFDDFNISGFRPDSGVVMLCYPSNPTGWIPSKSEIVDFMIHCEKSKITVILDLPYYNLFFDGSVFDYGDNVIVVSSFSKSIGLSGFRVGFVATKNENLFGVLRTRSLYKYNSISNLPQYVISEVLSSEKGRVSYINYRKETVSNIEKNIKYLNENGYLWDKYPSLPIGPFCVIKMGHDELMANKISSVPLDKFTIQGYQEKEQLSRISVAVDNGIFMKYFNEIKTEIYEEEKSTEG